MQERLARLGELLTAEGIHLRLVSGRRTCAQQNGLYALGRTAPGQIVTDARGCRSWHVVGRAVDFDFGQPPSLGRRPTEADYAHVGALWQSLGGVWGVRVSGGVDLPHLEYHPGLTITQVCPNPDACRDGVIVPSSVPPPSAAPPTAAFPWAEVAAAGAVAALAALVWRARS